MIPFVMFEGYALGSFASCRFNSPREPNSGGEKGIGYFSHDFNPLSISHEAS